MDITDVIDPLIETMKRMLKNKKALIYLEILSLRCINRAFYNHIKDYNFGIIRVYTNKDLLRVRCLNALISTSSNLCEYEGPANRIIKGHFGRSSGEKTKMEYLDMCKLSLDNCDISVTTRKLESLKLFRTIPEECLPPKITIINLLGSFRTISPLTKYAVLKRSGLYRLTYLYNLDTLVLKNSEVDAIPGTVTHLFIKGNSKCDLFNLVNLKELHLIRCEDWSPKIKELLKVNPEVKIFIDKRLTNNERFR